MRAGQNLDNGSRVICLKHIHSCRVNRLLEAQLNVILAVESFRGAAERWRSTCTLFPPCPIGSEQSCLCEIPRAGVDIGYPSQVPHGVGHAILTAIVGAEVQNLLGILLYLQAHWQYCSLARLHSPSTGKCFASCSAPGASPQTDIVKHAQEG